MMIGIGTPISQSNPERINPSCYSYAQGENRRFVPRRAASKKNMAKSEDISVDADQFPANNRETAEQWPATGLADDDGTLLRTALNTYGKAERPFRPLFR